MRVRNLSESLTTGLLLFTCWFYLAGDSCLAQRTASYKADIQPFLENHCYDCHGYGASEGDLALDEHKSVAELMADQKLWGKVWHNVLTETMPPADVDQPTLQQRKMLSEWIAEEVFKLSSAKPDPGSVTIRRLNREEYRYSVLDLLGIDFKVEDHFPADDTGYGFDTIGDVLTVPPMLMEKYFTAAEEIARRVENDYSNKKSRVYKTVYHSRDIPEESKEREKYLQQVLERLAEHAFRRPIDSSLVERLIQLVNKALQEGASDRQALSQAIVAVLVSPHFLFRAEFQPSPDDPSEVHLLDEFALASRLSFFLWSSIPDEELLDIAGSNRLRDELDAQVRRMINHPKSERFVKNFVGQWLRTRDTIGVHKEKHFRAIVDRLRPSMCRETELFFTRVMREDRDVMEFVTGNYTFVDERLARYYNIPDVRGKKMRLVELPVDSPRGGVLTHASILIVTSNPSRTSPVKRGQFILESILGTPAPPAPPEVPALEEVTRGVSWHMSMREQLAIHREDPLCSSCHDRMDPLGLAFEHFDAIGRWRDDDDGFPIDSSGQLVTGENFSGIRELRRILGDKPHLFYRCLSRKLMTYALGRGIDYTDIPTIEAIVDSMIENEGRFSTMLMGIVESPQFQLRQGYDSDSHTIQ